MAHQNDHYFLTRLTEDIFTEWQQHQTEIRHEVLHPCLLHGQPHLVTRKGLAREYPAAYCSLAAIADKYGVKIFEDRRNSIKKVVRDKRKQLALTVGLMIGITTRQLAFAEDLEHHTGHHTEPVVISSVTELSDQSVTNLKHSMSAKLNKTGSIRIARRQTGDLPKQLASTDKHSTLIQCLHGPSKNIVCDQRANPKTIVQIEQLLLGKLIQQNRNHSVQNVIHQIASYYALYPDVVRLINDLEQYDWSLHIAKQTWQARAFITQQRVQRVEVYFDPSTAAQMLFVKGCATLPSCTVSAADGLLHELLHAKLMLEDPVSYAKKNLNALYPVEHEHKVIALENQLYAAMSQVDNIPRPLRNQHQARLLYSDCPVCMPAKPQ